MRRISSFELMGKDWKQVIVEQYVSLVSLPHRCPSALKSLPRKYVVTSSRGPSQLGLPREKRTLASYQKIKEEGNELLEDTTCDHLWRLGLEAGSSFFKVLSNS